MLLRAIVGSEAFIEVKNMSWKNALSFVLPSEEMYRRDVKQYRNRWYLLLLVAVSASLFLVYSWPKVAHDPLFGVVMGLAAIVLVLIFVGGLIGISWMFRKLAQLLQL